MRKTRKSIIALMMMLAIILSTLPGISFASPPTPAVVVKTERVYLAMATGTGAFTDSVATVANDNVNDQALTENGNIRTFNNAYFIDSSTPTVKTQLKVATDYIPVISRPVSGLGPYQGNWIGAVGVYEFGFNAADEAIEFQRLLFDSYTGYGAPNTVAKTIRIGQFGPAAGDIHNTYKYDANTKAYIVAGTNASLTLTAMDFEDLVTDENDTIRFFYNYTSMTDRTLTEVFIVEAAGAGTRATTYENRSWSEGVSWNDPDYGYDGIENPYPVQFSLYDPVETGGKTDEAKYPLFIFFHGNGGAGTDAAGKQSVSANDGYTIGVTRYQDEFESNTEGVYGAYVVSARAVAELVTPASMGGQSWLNGYRYDSNPRYAAGDEAYKGKATQAAAMLSNIEWLIDTYPNIDPNRVYLASHSAGGYMVWAVLFEAARLGKLDLFAAAIPNQAAFFPSGGQLVDDYAEFELGLEDRLISVMSVPIWLHNSLNDTTCCWKYAAGDPFRMTGASAYSPGMGSVPGTLYMGGTTSGAVSTEPTYTMDKLGGARALWEAVINLKDVGGNPLSRVSTSLTMGHADTILVNNNIYPSGTAAREGITPTSYTRIYDEQPAGFNETTPGNYSSLAYTFGSSSVYSDGSYEDTITDWFNMCGAEKEKASVSISGPASVTYVPGETATYTVSIDNATDVSAVQITLKVDGDFLETKSFTGLSGFGVVGDLIWVPVGGGMYEGTIVLAGPAASGSFDIFQIEFNLRGLLGVTKVELIDFQIAYEGKWVDFKDGNMAAVTSINQWYSIFDLNQDGVVDLRDISIAMMYYMAEEGDANWAVAKIADVSGDGVVDIEDLIQIRANFT